MTYKNGSSLIRMQDLGFNRSDTHMDELLNDYTKIRHVYAAGIR